MIDVAPGAKIGASPWLADKLRGGTFGYDWSLLINERNESQAGDRCRAHLMSMSAQKGWPIDMKRRQIKNLPTRFLPVHRKSAPLTSGILI